jgi:hypothetical protein
MTSMESMDDPATADEQLKRLVSVLLPEDVLRHYGPADVLRHFGLEQLLRHLRELTPAERTDAELDLPHTMRETLREYYGLGAVASCESGSDGSASVDTLRELEGHDELVRRLLSPYSPDEVLRYLEPADVLRYYGLERLLRQLCNVTPRERDEIEAGVPPALLAVVREYVDEMP